MRKPRVLLGVFAHPDDESFGPGATLARYAAEGTQTHVIIATDGIAGSVEASTNLDAHETLAQLRSAELANAAVALGITAIWSWPYRDSGMRGTPANDHPDALIQQPIEALVEQMMEYIRRLQPDVLLTHDPFGGYGHPDHIRCCEVVTTAFHQAREEMQAAGSNGHTAHNGYRGPQKLYYTAFDKRLMRVIVRLMPYMGQDPTGVGRNKDINLVEIAQWDTPVHTRINVANYFPRKMAASRAHASQFSGGPTFVRILPKFLRQRFLDVDTYTRAYPAPNGIVENDLFAGVN